MVLYRHYDDAAVVLAASVFDRDILAWDCNTIEASSTWAMAAAAFDEHSKKIRTGGDNYDRIPRHARNT